MTRAMRPLRRSTRAWPASSSTPRAISKVNPETNSLLYRGYPVQELAADCSFEEVAYLLWHGELPDRGAAGRSFAQRERAYRALDPVGAVASSTSCRRPRTRWTSCAPPSA